MAGTVFSRGAEGAGFNMGNLLRRLPVLGLIVLIVLIATSGYTIDTGNVGVAKTLGTVNTEGVSPRFHLRLPFITEVREFSAKENSFDLTDLTPKAADNLSLRELDVAVFYKAAQDKITDLTIKYAATEERGPQGVYYPA